jgi:membrane protein DedA with SNARE-associated domain
MTEFMTFLIEHGYAIVFLWVFLDQAGLPLPAVPLLLAAGALVSLGQLELLPLFLVCLAASVPVDLFWFQLGRKRGGKVLNLLCAISLEPDYCVRNTEATFDKLGPLSLIIAKFVPGLQTLAPPMSGLTGMSMPRFLVLDTIGTMTWAGLFIGLGMMFSHQLESIAMNMASIGIWAGVIIAGLLVGYFGFKYYQRATFLRSLDMRRLEPKDVMEKIQNGESVHVIDLRHSYDVHQMPEKIPSAVSVPMEAMERHAHRIPRDSDIILYCS